MPAAGAAGPTTRQVGNGSVTSAPQGDAGSSRVRLVPAMKPSRIPADTEGAWAGCAGSREVILSGFVR